MGSHHYSVTILEETTTVYCTEIDMQNFCAYAGRIGIDVTYEEIED